MGDITTALILQWVVGIFSSPISIMDKVLVGTSTLKIILDH